MSEFTLKGGIEQNGDKWRAEVKLTTPDGKVTRLDSGYVFDNETEADASLQQKLDECLAAFTNEGVEVLSRNGVRYQW